MTLDRRIARLEALNPRLRAHRIEERFWERVADVWFPLGAASLTPAERIERLDIIQACAWSMQFGTADRDTALAEAMIARGYSGPPSDWTSWVMAISHIPGDETI